MRPLQFYTALNANANLSGFNRKAQLTQIAIKRSRKHTRSLSSHKNASVQRGRIKMIALCERAIAATQKQKRSWYTDIKVRLFKQFNRLFHKPRYF